MGSGGSQDSSYGVERSSTPSTQPSGSVEPLESPDKPSPRLPSTGRIEQAVDALERSLRRGDVDEKLLADLGWTIPQAQQFVDAYKRAKPSAQPPRADRTSVPTTQVFREEKPPGDRAVLRAGSPTAPGARSLNASTRRSPDTTRDLMEVGRQRVLPKYELLMEAYYRSLTSQPAK